MRIRKRKRIRPCRESEGFIVPSEAVVKINPVEGRDPCFVYATKE